MQKSIKLKITLYKILDVMTLDKFAIKPIRALNKSIPNIFSNSIVYFLTSIICNNSAKKTIKSNAKI